MRDYVVADDETQEDKQQGFHVHCPCPCGALRFVKKAATAPSATPINSCVHFMLVVVPVLCWSSSTPPA
jgi:hypothetical protein